MFGKKTYELPLARTYVANWGVKEAVRELIQNCIDADGEKKMLFTEDDDGTFRFSLHNEGHTLDPSSLVLGNTSKASDESKIGQFGEGYKLALLVLLRNDLRVTIFNGDQIWTPCFAQSKAFECEVLSIGVQVAESRNSKCLSFVIRGLSKDDAEEIRESYLGFNPPHEDQVIETRYGKILLDRDPVLYVNGLFVCKLQGNFAHAYDILPRHIELERDRSTVSNWSLASITTDMWYDSKQIDAVAAMIEAGTQDVSHATYSSPELVKEACFKLFKEQYPGGIPAASKSELDALVKKGFTNVVVVNQPMYNTVRGSASYKSYVTSHKASANPAAILEQFLEDNKSYLRRLGLVNFRKLIELAKDQKWSN